jgi:hypothetical protein
VALDRDTRATLRPADLLGLTCLSPPAGPVLGQEHRLDPHLIRQRTGGE